MDSTDGSASVSPGHGWFSVRCIFGRTEDGSTAYEERITLWQAAGFDQAIAQAEAEAEEYAGEIDCQYLGLAQAYHLDEVPGHGVEVYSLIRDSTLSPNEYATTFFDTGSERQES